jgi:hypothetical protein
MAALERTAHRRTRSYTALHYSRGDTQTTASSTEQVADKYVERYYKVFGPLACEVLASVVRRRSPVQLHPSSRPRLPRECVGTRRSQGLKTRRAEDLGKALAGSWLDYHGL